MLSRLPAGRGPGLWIPRNPRSGGRGPGFRRIVILSALATAACGTRTADEHLAYGDLAFEKGRYGRALESFTRALSLAPDRADIRVRVAEARLRRREYDRARQVLLQALRRDPGSRRAALLLVSSSLAAGRFDRAVDDAEHLARGGGDPALARTLLAEALEGRAEKRLRDLAREAGRRPGPGDPLRFLARLGRGDLEGARALLLPPAPALEDAAALLPLLDAARADREAARAAVEEALRREPRLPRARVLRAEMLLARGGKVPETEIEEAARVAGDRDLAIRALSLLATLRERSGDGPGAREAADRMVALSPANRTVRLRRALLRIRTGDLSGALEDARAFERARKASPLAAWVKGMVRLLQGNAREACPLLARAVRIEGEPGPHLWLALALLADGKPDLAAGSVERALARDPLLLPARLARGEVALVRDDPEGAERAARDVLRIEPGSAAGLVLLARAHLALADRSPDGSDARRGERERARAALGRVEDLARTAPGIFPAADSALRRALGERPREPILLRARVALFRAAGREEEAVEPLADLFAAAPGEPEGIALGLLLRETGTPGEALAAAREAVRRFPDAAAAWAVLALVAEECDPGEARAAAERAADLDLRTPLPAVLLADLRLAAGDPGGAARVALARRGLGTVARRAVLRSVAAEEAGRTGTAEAREARDHAIAWHLLGRWPARAARWAEAALARDPADTIALGILTSSRLARGDLPGAREAWRLLVHHDPRARPRGRE